MKYTVKANIFTQKNVSDPRPQSGSTPSEQLESVQSYKIITDIAVPGTGSLTPNALKSQLRDKFELVSPISESLSVNGSVVSGSSAITAYLVEYNATIPAPASISGSVSGSR